MNNLLSKIEAILFIYGEPIEMKKMAQILKMEEKEIKTAVGLLENELRREERGLSLIKEGDRIQLSTKPELSGLLEDLTKQEFSEDLTPASLETLSIIAYAGPLTRAELEYIRGVNSSFILRNLLMRGLIDRFINPQRTNAYIYKIGFDLFKKLGISSLDDLPEYKKYNDLMKILREESSSV